MKLSIDTSNSKSIVVGFDQKKFKSVARKEKSQKTLFLIDKILKKEGKSLKDITEIEVFIGPGSFTGLRVGVSVANALGWSLDIPVNGRDVKKGKLVEIKYI